MTWGSNATFRPIRCRWCGIEHIDDRDDESTHEISCARRPNRLIRWLLRVFA